MLSPDLLWAFKAGQSLRTLTFSRASTATRRNRLGTLESIASGIHRLNWEDPDADGVFEEPTELLEGSRTNAWTYSEQLDNAVWTKGNASITANAVAAPDGQTTADKVVEDATAAVDHGFNRNTPSLTDNTLQAVSIFANAGERTWFRIKTTSKANTPLNTWFDLTNGVIGTQNHTTAWIEDYGNGWYRCSVMFDAEAGATAPICNFNLAAADGGGAYNGDGTSGAYFWGVQFEVDQAFPSSYIQTVASTVTRQADSLTDTLNFGVRDLTIYSKLVRPLHADVTGDLGFAPGILSISSIESGLAILFAQATRQVTAQIRTATDVTVNAAIPAGNTLELAVQYRNLRTGGNVRLDVGSGFGGWSGNASAFTAFGDSTINIGNRLAASQYLHGGLIIVKVVAGLKTLTEARDFPTPVGR
jgi:hypothetical protein